MFVVGLVWVYVEKWIDDDDVDDGGDHDDGDDVDDDRQSPYFFFSFSWYMYTYMYPLATQKQQVGIDDDMNNKHVHFFVFPSFFSCSFGRYLVPRYLPRGIPPRWGHICI